LSQLESQHLLDVQSVGDLMRKACEENGPYTDPLFDEPDTEDILSDIVPDPAPEAKRRISVADLFTLFLFLSILIATLVGRVYLTR